MLAKKGGIRSLLASVLAATICIGGTGIGVLAAEQSETELRIQINRLR